MQPESTSATIDMRYIWRTPSTSMKFYTLFLLVVCVVTILKLVRVWRAAPPFRLARQAKNPDSLRSLQTTSHALTQWMGCVVLTFGIFFSTSLYDLCDRLMGDKQIGGLSVLFIVQDYATAANMTLLVLLFIFLVRWHLRKRIDQLG